MNGRRIYLASSWRNEHQPRILALLRSGGHEVYDFRNPQRVSIGVLGPVAGSGFSWSQVDPDWKDWSPYGYLAGLRHPLAEDGFRLDFDAMKWADTCVLLLPSGPSAALELGWCAGAGKRTVVHVVDLREPDLMYKVADRFTLTDEELLTALRSDGVAGDQCEWPRCGAERPGNCGCPASGCGHLTGEACSARSCAGERCPWRGR